MHQGLIFVWGESGPNAEHESAASAIHGSDLLDELGGEALDPHTILILDDKKQQRVAQSQFQGPLRTLATPNEDRTPEFVVAV